VSNKEKIIAAMENNLCEKLQYIPIKHPSMSVAKVGNVLLVDSCMPSDTFNTCFGGDISDGNTKQVFELKQT